MADYITDYSGDQINEAIGIALNMQDRILEMNIFGSTNLTPNETSDPVDLSKLETPGIYTANKYTNGPDFTANSTTGSTPIQIQVTAHHNDVGTVDKIFQTVISDGKTAYRYKEPNGVKWGNWINSSEVIRVDGTRQASSGDYVSIYKVDSKDIVPADGAHFIMKVPGPNAEDPQIMIDTTKYKVRTITNDILGVGSMGTNAYVEFYFGKDPTNPTDMILFVTGVTNSADKQDSDTTISNIFKGVEGNGPGVIVNTAAAGTKAVLKSTTMTAEEADAIHALTKNDATKSKIAATDSTGKLTVTKLTLAEAEKLHNLIDPNSQTGSTTSGLVTCTDIGTAPITVAEITADMLG